MSTQVRGSNITAEAAEAITRYQLLYLNSTGKWAVATATSAPAIAVAADNAASGSPLCGVLISANGTLKMVASAAVTLGDPVYQGASGKCSSVVAGGFIGFAMQAASADADIIEVRPPTPAEIVAYGTPFRAYTADATLGRAQSGMTISNLGAAGTVTLTLPQDAPKGTRFFVAIQTAQALRIDPGAAGAFYVAGAKQTDDKYLWADDEGESAIFTADGAGDWVVTHVVGTWTIEP
jgi:hypothetical protein